MGVLDAIPKFRMKITGQKFTMPLHSPPWWCVRASMPGSVSYASAQGAARDWPVGKVNELHKRPAPGPVTTSGGSGAG